MRLAFGTAHRLLVAASTAALLLAAGCENPSHDQSAQNPPSSGIAKSGMLPMNGGGVRPGIHPAVVYGNRTNPHATDASAISQGRQLFVAYNCSGCHGGRAGGGMGPSLRDSLWLYGDSDTQLFATIIEGRPAGMPAWGGKSPENQIWQLVSYIRTLGTPQEPDRIVVK